MDHHSASAARLCGRSDRDLPAWLRFARTHQRGAVAMSLPARMLKICEAQLEGQPISEHDRAYLQNKIHPERDQADQRAARSAQDRLLRQMAAKLVNKMIAPKARTILRRWTAYRAGPWQYERSMIAPPVHHRDLWELMRLGEFIPSESRLRRILAAGSRRGQKIGF
jgi:hypothetical protein